MRIFHWITRIPRSLKTRENPEASKHRLLLFILALGTFGSAAGPLPAHANPSVEKAAISLGQGEQRILHIRGLKRFSIGGNSIRVISPSDKDALLIKGAVPGFSDLWVWKEDGSSEHRSVTVEKWARTKPLHALDQALGRLQEAEVLPTASGVILRGEISSLAEATRISALRRGFPKEVKDETLASEDLLLRAQTELEEWLKKSSFAERLRIERQDRSLWVRGFLPNPSARAGLEKQIYAIFPLAELDIESLPDRSPTIYFRVYLLEVKKNGFSRLGIRWPSEQAGAFRVTSWGVKEALQLDLTLEALEGQGTARVLSRPELVVRAPGEAELFAGGEIPIRSSTRYSSQITWRPHGLTLRLKVAQTTGDRIRLDIHTEVSHLDPTPGDDTLPSLKASRMKTQVDARLGVPLLLSGLLQEEMRKKAQGIPLLRQIPILGSLFGSTDYLNERSELVAILLPQASPPRAPMEKFARMTPRGPAPPPRNWISPQEERALRTSSQYPWNALE